MRLQLHIPRSRPGTQGRCVTRHYAGLMFGAATLCLHVPVAAQSPAVQPLSPEELAEMSLEDLMGLEVTSVAGVSSGWFSTPAAISVITGEDVRRSGHRSLAEALRLAPGVFVGQTNSSTFSVGTRGFNGSLANKTLVLIDGRAVYDRLFGGTFWNVQDVLLEDLERIEVIRGPGATLWGSNAVNGVINVTTKDAKETQGLFVSAGGGTYERAFGEARYGLRLGESTWARIYGKWFQRDHMVDISGDRTHDDWDMARGGFRIDHDGDDGLTFTVQGDAYDSDQIGELTRAVPVPGQSIQFVNDIRDVRNTGANLLMSVGREHEDHGWAFKAYYDRVERVTNVQLHVERDTLDVDWRHHFRLGAGHDILWGVGARHSRDRTQDGYSLLFQDSTSSFNILSSFVQDTITLVPGQLFAMIGSKFSHNDHTGFEVQPSGRLWWTPDDRQTLWGSVSRAVRIPSLIEERGMIAFGYIDTGILAGASPSGQIVALGVEGNDRLKAEVLMAYEAGYRLRATDTLTFDASVFYNDYDDLIYVHSVIEPWNNEGFGETYGGEIAVSWEAAENWRVSAAYSFVNTEIHGPVAPADETNTPRHQAQIHSYLDLSEAVEMNTAVYFVDEVPHAGAESYVRLDLGLTWRPTRTLELSVWGQNLLDARHREFSPNEVERGFYVMGSLRF